MGVSNLQKAARREEVADVFHDAVAQFEALVHRGSAQI
jgi:hypothetical protein